MKKRIFILLSFLLCFSLNAEIRTFYVTRHGQRGDLKYRVQFKNVTEDALMPKGEEQAKLLGKYLNSLGFNGTVYVSPYYRTLQTAYFACEQLPGIPVILEPRFQEVAGVKDASGITRINEKCLTKNEIKKNFPGFKIPKKMKFPWRLENEMQSQLDKRTADLLEDLLKNTSGDIFLVGHGGSVDSLVREMNRRDADFKKPKTYNCCLYIFKIDSETGKVVSAENHTYNYLSADYITDNLAVVLPPADAYKTTE